MTKLPATDPRAEDAFVASLLDAPFDRLADVVRDAVAARRWQLAARVVGLIDEDVEDPALQTARRAAGLVVHGRLSPEAVSWSSLDEALRAAHRDRVHRAQLRQRRAARGDDTRVGRVSSWRRRR